MKPRSAKPKKLNTQPANAGAKIALPRRKESKQQKVLDLLERAEGTTIAAIVKTSGWQPHSVRGFLAGVVRKRLGLHLMSEKAAGGRVYRIGPPIDRPNPKASARKRKLG